MVSVENVDEMLYQCRVHIGQIIYKLDTHEAEEKYLRLIDRQRKLVKSSNEKNNSDHRD